MLTPESVPSTLIWRTETLAVTTISGFHSPYLLGGWFSSKLTLANEVTELEALDLVVHIWSGKNACCRNIWDEFDYEEFASFYIHIYIYIYAHNGSFYDTVNYGIPWLILQVKAIKFAANVGLNTLLKTSSGFHHKHEPFLAKFYALSHYAILSRTIRASLMDRYRTPLKQWDLCLRSGSVPCSEPSDSKCAKLHCITVSGSRRNDNIVQFRTLWKSPLALSYPKFFSDHFQTW